MKRTKKKRPEQNNGERFEGFSPAAIAFLRGLAKNNKREWFNPRKHVYEAELLAPLRALVADASEAMRKAKIPIGAQPTGSIFRIYRDIRFSPDKRPYKTNLGAYLPPSGKEHGPGGLYVHIQPKESFITIAFYQLDKPVLQRWRSAMAKDPKRFQTMLHALKRNGLEINTEHATLKRMPRGFEDQAPSPIADYFRMDSFTVSESLTDKDVSNRRLIDRMVALANKAKPLLDYGRSLK